PARATGARATAAKAPTPPKGPPKPPPAPGAKPQVGQRVSLQDDFRGGPAAGAPKAPVAAASVDLGGLLAKITENDAPRWMVVKDGLDHGPFSGRELVELIVKSDVREEHDLLNMDTGERKPIQEWEEFGEFIDQARIRREEEARVASIARAESAEKRSGTFKIAIAAAVALVFVAGVVIFFATREAGGEEEVAQADLGDLFERGEIELSGTAGILPDPPRRRRGGGGGGMRRTVMGGSFVGSYEQAMNVAIELGDATMSGGQGRLSPAQVQNTMNRQLNRIFNACVVPESRRGGRLGNVQIDIAIAGSGQVMGVSARQGSGAFKSCIRRTVRGVRFPSFGGQRMGARYSFSAQ
ncbi:MAG TPA: hypothetical protein RMG95_18590, partial [Polyangiaceae bacterium LLY-WYZ-15_(1-7)]|nr:hypothetical protein [Polyangiaceae bacterium LLY-WYZ-15_(1-7)]